MNDIDNLIYSTARGGSPENPGLPAALSYLLVAQARHETGNYTSNFFKNNNNLFGYSYVPGGRYQSGSGNIADNGQPIASYPALKYSVYELIDWIYRRKKEGKFPALSEVVSPDQYAALLKSSGYFTDSVSNYAAGLKRFFLNNPVAATGGGLLILAIVLSFIFRKRLF